MSRDEAIKEFFKTELLVGRNQATINLFEAGRHFERSEKASSQKRDESAQKEIDDLKAEIKQLTKERDTAFQEGLHSKLTTIEHVALTQEIEELKAEKHEQVDMIKQLRTHISRLDTPRQFHCDFLIEELTKIIDYKKPDCAEQEEIKR